MAPFGDRLWNEMGQKIPKTKRARGRPRRPGDEALQAGGLARASIVERAFEMTRNQSLSDVSIVRLAQSLNVRPGTIHYHLGSRDNLITAVMNRFYQDILQTLERGRARSNWQDELRRHGEAWLDAKLRYPGVASYVAANDRFRVFQKPAQGEADHGAQFMDRIFSLLARAGFTPDAAAQCWHLMALYINATAQTIAMKHAPAEHSGFLLDRAQRFAKGSFPGLAFALSALARLDAMAAFDRSFDELIAGYARQVTRENESAPEELARKPAHS
jgi:AcrR family transcriptional regulator